MAEEAALCTVWEAPIPGRALRRYVTAGVVLAGASLIAVTPVARPPLDLQERAVELTDASALLDPASDPNDITAIMQAVSNLGLTDINDGVTQIGAGDVPTGLENITTGLENIFVAVPQDLFLGTIDAAVGQPIGGVVGGDYLKFTPFSPPVEGLNEIIATVQLAIQAGMSEISTGLGNLAQDVVNAGLVYTIGGLDDIFVSIPDALFTGSVDTLLASL